MPTDSSPNRRRTSRVRHRTRIVLSGKDAAGFSFAEETETITVSKHGAALRTAYHLTLGQEVSIRTKAKDRSGQFQVVWIGEVGTPAEGRIGVEWLEARHFWGVEFPPEDWQSA